MASEKPDTSWRLVAVPVLERLLAAEREDRTVYGEELRALAEGATDRVFHNTMCDLIDEAFIGGRRYREGGERYYEYADLRLLPRGRQVVRDWPTENVFDALITALDAAIDGATEPAERTKLERLKASSLEVGQGMLTSVLAAVVTQVAGLR